MAALLSLALVLSACNDNSDTNVKRKNSVTPVKVTVLALNDFHGNLELPPLTRFRCPARMTPPRTRACLPAALK